MRNRIATAAVTLLVVISAYAESGKCGAEATWSLVGNTLTISGSGTFDHYGLGNYDAYRDAIKHVVIEQGITGIGDCAFDGYTNIETIDIPSSVTSIGFSAISGCANLRTLTIPSSVTSMKVLAVWNLAGLQAIVVPDRMPERTGNATGEFFDLTACSNLQSAKTNSGSNALYMAAALPPQIRKQMEEKSFRMYAESRINARLKQWAAKGEFETSEQWRQRVNETTYKAEAEKLVAKEKENFVREKAPSKPTGTLGTYDADQGAFPVHLSDGTTVYVGVPIGDAPAFKSNWSSVKLYPKYGVVNDEIAMLSCTFEDGGKKYGLISNYNEDSSQQLALNLPSFTLDEQGASQNIAGRAKKRTTVDTSIDRNIPTGALQDASNTFAVIIGNENYQRVAKVQYAANDAKVFGEYCQKTLGIPYENIRSYKDATFGTMLAAIKDIQDISKAYKGDINVIFYYAGHGVPSESDKSAYLLPVDADGSQTAACLSTKQLYDDLNNLGARQVLVLMDACFSGAQRGDGMLASARGVALKVKDDVPTGNVVVFTAANGEQTAYPYNEKGHGMFTYFLLKKLQDTKGDVSLGDLCDYVSNKVAQQSVVTNKHNQTPTVIPSPKLSDSWRSLKL